MVNSKDACPSEASNISAASSEGLNTNYEKQSMMMKMKEEVIDDQGGSQLLDLKLSNNHNDHDDDTKLERNLLKSVNMAGVESSLSTRHNHQNRAVDEEKESKGEKARAEIARVFTCKICKREFSSSQALGGHQSAHRQEKATAKKKCKEEMSGNYYPYYPCSFGNNNSSSLLNNNRASGLGVRYASLIHKPPSYPWSSRFAHNHGWSRPLQPSFDHRINNIGGFQTHGGSSSSTSARFDFLGSRFERSGASDAIISATNMAITKAVGRDGMLFRGGHADSEQVDPSPEIDLSLKL